ncbi:MAG: nuclear transport factor 2 family protein [Microthrixaceae bacterium]
MDPATGTGADLAAVERLQRRYGDVVTRRAWSELADLFEPTCPIHLDLRGGRTVDLVGAGDLATMLTGALERFELFVFTILNSTVEVDHGGAREAIGRVYIRELRQDRDGVWSEAVGVYRDRYRHDGRCWRYAARDYATIARTSRTDVTYEVFEVPT